MTVKKVIVIVIITTFIFSIVDYRDIFLENHSSINDTFWLSYIALLIAIILPMYLFDKEKNERLNSEDEVRKATEEKEEKNIFMNGISRVRPKIDIEYQKVIGDIKKEKNDTLKLHNIGIGNATSVQIYCQYSASGKKVYKLALPLSNNYRNSSVTLQPNHALEIEDLWVENSYGSYSVVTAKQFKKLLIIYCNIVGSEIYISELKIDENKAIKHNYFSSYNVKQPDVDKNELLDILDVYVYENSLCESVYKFEEFIKEMGKYE